MDTGQTITIWIARAAVAAYAWSVVLMAATKWKPARLAMTIALVLYLIHVCGAFHYFYSWSHSIAEAETTRQTRELFGAEFSGGIYLNYAFTAVWIAYCTAWWRRPNASVPRLTLAVQAFLLFMFINASVVVWILEPSAASP